MALSLLTLLLVFLFISLLILSLLMCADSSAEGSATSSQVERRPSTGSKKTGKKREKKRAPSKIGGGGGRRSSIKLADNNRSSVSHAKQTSSIQAANSRGGSLPSKVGGKFAPRSTDFKSSTLSEADGGSGVKSTGSGYYAILAKQKNIKSVSMYGMPPK